MQTRRPKSEAANINAAEWAYNYIRDRIIDGSYAMGSKLVEGDIAEAAGVSRTPVREALRRLSSDGLVIFKPGRGGSVASISRQEILEIYSLRAVLESEVAARACRNMDNPTLDKLEILAHEMEAAINADQPGHLSTEGVRQVAVLNSDFHGLLIKRAESPWHARALTPLTQLSLAYRTLSTYSMTEHMRSQGHHRELIAAFVARDAEWAKSTMRSHILAARATLLRAFGERGGEQPEARGQGDQPRYWPDQYL